MAEQTGCGHCGADHPSIFCGHAPEMIIRASIRTPDGRAWSTPIPGRHHNLIARLSACGYGPEALADQGFRTNKREFVDRVEGLAIAKAAGQIKKKVGNPDELYSEDIW